jgi:hypothetical protein
MPNGLKSERLIKRTLEQLRDDRKAVDLEEKGVPKGWILTSKIQHPSLPSQPIPDPSQGSPGEPIPTPTLGPLGPGMGRRDGSPTAKNGQNGDPARDGSDTQKTPTKSRLTDAERQRLLALVAAQAPAPSLQQQILEQPDHDPEPETPP